jgi:hypothetical protein
MLKTRRGAQVWLITQPAHAELAGQMAAHWGNDAFAMPGSFAPSADPERLRREVVFAVSEHDNGWWEWEADPPLSSEDGLPQGLDEVVADPVAGMERWRLGVPRFSDRHPYASLLIGDHAYGLYAARFTPDYPPELTHHLLAGHTFYPSDQHEEAKRFMSALREMQGGFQRRLKQDAFWKSACGPEQRIPHARLLQTLDALSLALCSAALAPVAGNAQGLGEDQIVLQEVPRRRWADRVSLTITPLGDGRITVDPYPFDVAPLTVSVLARVVQPGTWWPQAPWLLKQFTFSRQ